MIPRIKEIVPQEDYQLLVVFDDNYKVLYNLNEDIDTISEFKLLKNNLNLYKNLRLDESRTCVYWNERIDLPSDTIYEYGKRI